MKYNSAVFKWVAKCFQKGLATHLKTQIKKGCDMKHLAIAAILAFILTGCLGKNDAITSDATPTKRMSRVNEYELGKISYSKGDYARAVQYQTQWLVKYPDDASAYTERGLAYNKLNKSDAALSDFTKACELAPEALSPRIYKCAELAGLGKREQAKEMLSDIMADARFSGISPYEKFLAYSLDGQFKMKAGEHEEALPSLNNALRVFSGNSHVFAERNSHHINRLAYYNRSVVHNQLGNYPQAAEDMEAYVTTTQKAKQRIGSKDYARLAIAYYLAEDYAKCKAVSKYISPEDRRMLAETLDDEMFLEE